MDSTSFAPEASPPPVPARVHHSPIRTFRAEPGSLPERVGRRFPGRPVAVDLMMDAAGYVVMATLLIGLGLLLTTVLVDGPVGRWDLELSRRLVASRSPLVNGWTEIGSTFGDTLTVIAIATVATLVLALRRAWAHAAFLVGALLIEVTSFLTTTFVIDRHRPPVRTLDVAPPTSSFPSGHTAAAMVLWVALAVIVTSYTRTLAVRIIAWALAVLVPAAVAISRMQRGMHYATDIAGSVIGAIGCLLLSMLAVRAACSSWDAGEPEEPERVAV
jgi:undecaprenyl-diphosphatase